LISGASEEDARARALAQVADWRLLECELSRVEGATVRFSEWRPAEFTPAKSKGRVAMRLLQDVQFGARMLLKSKAYTVVAVLSLALGIGANTAIFSLINVVLLKMLPVEQPEQLYFIEHRGPNRSTGGAPPYPCFERFREHQQFFT